MNASCHCRGHQWAKVERCFNPFILLIPGKVLAITHCLILQWALSPLITDGAIEGVINQQEFHRTLLCLDSCRRLCLYHHPVGNRSGAGRQWFRCLLYLNQTHPAVRGNGQLRVITEPWDINIRRIRRLDNHASRLCLNLTAINHNRHSCPGVHQAASSPGIMASNSWRKCLRKLCTGQAAASPSAQIVRPSIRSATDLRRSRSW